MDIDMDTVYIFNEKEMQLKDIITIINTGDIIKGINNYIIANAVVSKINKNKNSKHTYLFDGPNQIILF
jgi:hypothetical protein